MLQRRAGQQPIRQNSYAGDTMAPTPEPQPNVIIGAPGPVMQQAQNAGMAMPGSPGIQSSTAQAPVGPDVHPMDPGGAGESPIAPMHPTDPIAPAPPAAQTHQPTSDNDYDVDPYSPYPEGGNYNDVYGMKHQRGRRLPPRRPPAPKPILPPAPPVPITPQDPIAPPPAPDGGPGRAASSVTAGQTYGSSYQNGPGRVY